MSTLMFAPARAEILRRLRTLTPDTPAVWGTMDAPRALCHLTDQLRVAVGAAEVNRQDTFMRRTVLKWVVVHGPFQAPPGKVQTTPEMLVSCPVDWNEDMAECIRLIEEVATGEANGIHPAFGPLTGTEWAKLGWRHLDHHLRQFGA